MLTKFRSRLAAMSSVEYLPERVSMLYRLSGTDVPIILVAASITAFALWGYIGVNLIASWFVWLGVASTLRNAAGLSSPPAAGGGCGAVGKLFLHGQRPNRGGLGPGAHVYRP